MSSSTPRETTGALPEWSGIQKTDKSMIIDPILQQYRTVIRAALQEHMNLVTSQYMTGYARASRESGIGAAMPMDPPSGCYGTQLEGKSRSWDPLRFYDRNERPLHDVYARSYCPNTALGVHMYYFPALR
jgi:hypothetical protein